jgi:hypothetical protein
MMGSVLETGLKYYVVAMTAIMPEVMSVEATGAATIAAVGARQVAKAEVFAVRTAPELKGIYKWGNGIEGVQKARGALDVSTVQGIQSSVSKAEVESMRKFYVEVAASGRGGAVAPERAAYMQDILNLRK